MKALATDAIVVIGVTALLLYLLVDYVINTLKDAALDLGE